MPPSTLSESGRLPKVQASLTLDDTSKTRFYSTAVGFYRKMFYTLHNMFFFFSSASPVDLKKNLLTFAEV